VLLVFTPVDDFMLLPAARADGELKANAKPINTTRRMFTGGSVLKSSVLDACQV
jgi:hypothetical protein